VINRKFKNNWLEIINFNSKVNIVEDPNTLQDLVRIPLTPIKIKANVLYYLFQLFYPKFINNQPNILDIVLSDYDIENKTLGIYLYETKKVGIHESVESISKDLIVIQEKDLKDIDKLFTKIQSIIFKKFNLKISSIRIFKRRAIDNINRYCENLENLSFYEFLAKLLDLYQKLLEEDLFLIYPEPTIFQFFKKAILIINGITFSKIFEYIVKLIFPFSTSVIFSSNRMSIKLQIQKEISNNQSSKLNIGIENLPQIEDNTDRANSNILMNIDISELKTKNILIINQDDFLSILSDFFNMELPLRKLELKLFFQKILFGYRSYEIHWNMVPKPKIYNVLLRFLIRLLGVNINLRKLSHWAIPELIFNLIDTYFGLNSNIILLLTSAHESQYNIRILLKIENSSLVEVIPLNIMNSHYDSLKTIRLKYSNDHGFISSIIKIDRNLVQDFLNFFTFKYGKLKFFNLIKLMNRLTNSKYLQIYPEIPPYKLIKNKRSFSLLKALLAILIDKHEF